MGSAVHPNNKRAVIPEDSLRELYVAQGLTLGQMAMRFGMSATTVRRRFADVGIPARPRGPAPKHSSAGSANAVLQWSGDLAYIVGLIATDGNLSPNERTLALTSKDIDLLETVRGLLGLATPITPNPGGWGPTYRLQWTSRAQ